MTIRAKIGGRAGPEIVNLDRRQGELLERVTDLERGQSTKKKRGIDAPSPRSPLVVGRRVTPAGEFVTLSLDIPDTTQEVKAVVRKLRANGTLGPALPWSWDDVTDAARENEQFTGEFGHALDFEHTYYLVKLVSKDDDGNRARNPENEQTDAQQLGNPLAIFMTGAPMGQGPGGHQGVRNGRFHRSVKGANGGVGTDAEAIECWLWHLGTRRDIALRATGHPSVPPFDALWDKVNGVARLGRTDTTLAQRFRTRQFSGGDEVNLNLAIRRPLLLGAPTILADIVVRLVSVFGSTNKSDGIRQIIAETRIPQAGAAGARVEAAAALLAPGSEAVIDPEPTQPVLVLGQWSTLEVSLLVDQFYTIGSTQEPGPGHNGGQWLEIALENKTGSTYYEFDRVRFGYGVGGWTPHAEEESGTVGDVEISNGGGRGTAGYGRGFQEVARGTGSVLRQFTD